MKREFNDKRKLLSGRIF